MRLIGNALKALLPRAFLPAAIGVAIATGVVASYFLGDDSLVEEVAEEAVAALLGSPEFDLDFTPDSKEGVDAAIKQKATEILAKKKAQDLTDKLMERIVTRAEDKLSSKE